MLWWRRIGADSKRNAGNFGTVHGLNVIHQQDVAFHPIESAHNLGTAPKRLHTLEE